MEEERQVKTEIATDIEPSEKQDIALDNLPRLEDLIKSEQEVKSETKLQGLTNAETNQLLEDRQFTRKEDEHKKFVKKRLKLVTGIYIAIATLMLGFVGANIATQAILHKKITDNTNTIKSEQNVIDIMKDNDTPDGELTGEKITITLNQPRDYNDDNHTLTIFDKLTILFRNLFN